MALRVFTCIDHEGHYPVGVSSLIVAESEEEARRLLVQELKEHSLDQGDKPFTLREMNVTSARAYVLQDGEY